MRARLIKGLGQQRELCIADFNIEVETGGCAVYLDANNVFCKKDHCLYCYAARSHRINSRGYEVAEIDEKHFVRMKKKYPIHVVRIGKMTECGHKVTRAALYKLLEIFVRLQIRPIVTSKLLEYDPEVSRLVKASNGVIHISLGRDDAEPGAVRQGATNEWRLEQILLYIKDNCPTQARLVADITQPMTTFHKKVAAVLTSKHILLTPLFYTGKKDLACFRPGVSWEEAKDSDLYVQAKQKNTEKAAKNLYAIKFHPDWESIRQRCGRVGDKNYCNNCVGKIDFNKKEYKAELIRLGWNTETAE